MHRPRLGRRASVALRSGSQADEPRCMTPAVVLDGGVDDHLDDHLRADLGVDGQRAGSTPAGGGQHLGPRVAGSDLPCQQCGDRGARRE